MQTMLRGVGFGFCVLASARLYAGEFGIAKVFSNSHFRAAALEARANQTVKKLATLAGEGNAASSDEVLQQMQQIVDELVAIRAELKSLRAETGKVQSSVSENERFQPSGFIQFQFRDSDEAARNQSSFNFRRVRLGATYRIDKKLSFKIASEFASGTNNLQSQLWEAYGLYSDGPYRYLAGQFVFPLGFDIPRPTAEQEFPERALYNRRLFEGENGRGLGIRYSNSRGFMAQVGLWDALSTGDPEQINLQAGTHGKLAGTVTARYANQGLDAGVSAYVGTRPTYESANAILSDAKRQFVYLDAAWTPKAWQKLTLRGEVMWGRDRMPNGTDAHALSGWQAAVVYRPTPKTEFGIRNEVFDPFLGSAAAPHAISTWTGVFSYWLTSKAKVSLSYAAVMDPARNPKRYSVLTARLYIRF